MVTSDGTQHQTQRVGLAVFTTKSCATSSWHKGSLVAGDPSPQTLRFWVTTKYQKTRKNNKKGRTQTPQQSQPFEGPQRIHSSYKFRLQLFSIEFSHRNDI
ncbi:hypothetical protein MCOR14_003976 [Pyricularia oryzae]|nr:hypothetical protein MCOR34_000528 [Pyricularia oryzae]KAI6455194.1 hypothetical protein MCOR17_008767 [Pyricularia oryzae]KAI6497112.1 hypothetical protein MCOR13_006801 [Pyricularia oryzae]KAI6639282.1 hypothetical protein MCOR14_003976 [Pyricularia oryzae]